MYRLYARSQEPDAHTGKYCACRAARSREGSTADSELRRSLTALRRVAAIMIAVVATERQVVMERSESPLRVLVVEDSEIMGTLLTRLLAHEDDMRLIGVAVTPAAALAAFESLAPHAVVLDLLLAEGSGFDVLRSLNRRPTQPPDILVLTNLATEAYRSEALHLGASQFFDKSREIPAMMQALRTLAGKLPDHAHGRERRQGTLRFWGRRH
jgi:CheY-like chemotaxis protein